MLVPEKRKPGRPSLAEDERRKNRGLSLNDNEYARLRLLTRKAGMGDQTSAYIVKTLNLSV